MKRYIFWLVTSLLALSLVLADLQWAIQERNLH
jgi:hypothetical protein